MAKRRGIKGRMLDVRAPEWEPLIDVAPLHLGDFMWMFAVELSDKTRLQAYKHYWTRSYLHLDGDGRAFAYREPDRYEEVDVGWVLWRVLDEHVAEREWIDLFHPLTLDPDAIGFEWADSVSRNGITQERAAHVIRHCGLRFKERAPFEAPHPDEFRTLFVGADQSGTELEIAAIEMRPEQRFFVYHAAPMRDEYLGLLARAGRWCE